MPHVLIIHEVADDPAWKKVFDRAAGIRKEAGERTCQVLKYHQDANKIVHFSTWTSHGDARASFESPRLIKIREQAGVMLRGGMVRICFPENALGPAVCEGN